MEKRLTNLEKWNSYYKLIEQRNTAFINTNIPNIPEKIYEVCKNGEIKELSVTDVYCSNKLHHGDKVTRKQVEEIKKYYDNPQELSISDIRIGWTRKDNIGICSSAIKFKELDGKYFTDIKKAKEEADKLSVIAKKEEDLLASGDYVRCAYCSKIIAIKDAYSSSLIFQNSKFDGYRTIKFVDSKTNLYCSSKCASYDQMAHEG